MHYDVRTLSRYYNTNTEEGRSVYYKKYYSERGKKKTRVYYQDG